MSIRFVTSKAPDPARTEAPVRPESAPPVSELAPSQHVTPDAYVERPVLRIDPAVVAARRAARAVAAPLVSELRAAVQSQLERVGADPKPESVGTLQTGIRQLYEGMFGVRPFLTLGGHLTHDLDRRHELSMATMGYAVADRSWLAGFSAASQLPHPDAVALLERFTADWRSLGAIERHIQETPSPLPELLAYAQQLVAVAAKPDYGQHLFVHRTLEAYEEARRAAETWPPPGT